jgi:hypothetical protein
MLRLIERLEFGREGLQKIQANLNFLDWGEYPQFGTAKVITADFI